MIRQAKWFFSNKKEIKKDISINRIKRIKIKEEKKNV